MDVLKLVISGDVNSGKTTFITAISEIEPITTDEEATDEVRNLKEKTTVAMDFGQLTIDEDLVLHIYGTPGQDRFDFMWDLLSENAFGVIFLADSTSPESIKKSAKIIDYFVNNLGQEIPYLIGITKLDLPNALPIGEVVDMIGKEYIEYLPVNATKINDVKAATITLISNALA